MKKVIVAIGAHLDDIELAAGGTLAKAVRDGHDVHMIVMSQSGYTDYNGKVMRTNETAMQEGRNAARVLGCKDLDILDFSNKDIAYDSRAVEAIEKRINIIKPDIIFTHWPFDTHQAHVAVGKSTISAARRYNTIYFFEPISPSGRSYVGFRPQLYVDITEVIDKKIAALDEHVTEKNKYGDYWIRGVQARAAFRGYEMGRMYGEAFEVLREELMI
ncbi:MAG: PIG-L family deacetylase [Lachnospiraceae bacterium]|nr:PIG-L family deacetylase [Lachnospiraceae bacterium]MBQ2099755.1 PIG-L family deacetylase [Lachnospiraceae bacterium]MBQ3906227.1 PIG-L family deacetylase [Lachnospiraceae bacterium]MCR4599158.1 PIG-L family deacetylase [Acetatifactor sp.]